MEKCAKARSPTVPPYLAKELESPMTPKEVEIAIAGLKNGKSPGLDGLPSEFYKMFKDYMIQPLMKVWEEALIFQALPCSINTRVIKLIHKRGEKEDLSN